MNKVSTCRKALYPSGRKRQEKKNFHKKNLHFRSSEDLNLKYANADVLKFHIILFFRMKSFRTLFFSERKVSIFFKPWFFFVHLLMFAIFVYAFFSNTRTRIFFLIFFTFFLSDLIKHLLNWHVCSGSLVFWLG